MRNDDVDTLRRAAKLMLGLANSAPDGKWCATENTIDLADENGGIWDPDTYWVESPKRCEEERTVALAYGNVVAEYIARLGPRTVRSVAVLLNAVAGEYESMLTSAHYLDVSDRDASARLRRGPAGLNAAVVTAQAFLGELEEIEDEDDEAADIDG